MDVANAAIYRFLEEPDEWGRPEEPIAAGEVEEFEHSEGVVLPDALKRYWQRYGGRQFNSKTIFTFQTKALFPSGKRKRVDVGVIADPRTMREARQRYMDPLYNNSGPRLPAGLYPLSFDSGYGHCLLDLNAETYGRILHIVIKAKTFGDHGYGWDHVGHVANDFESFLAGLTPSRL
jgi:SMI1 / KNR4 family (SUKH-1)